MTKAEMERVKVLVDKHKYTEEEALDIVQSDKAIDRGERVYFDLDPEQEKIAKKYANAGTRKAPTVYKFDQKDKKRKENPTKGAIIQHLFENLQEYNNVTIVNKERQISFSVGDENYELTLVQKRKPKK